VYTFDRLAEETPAGQTLPAILRTRQRKVVTLRFGIICCREVLRQAEQSRRARPSGLEKLVGKGLRYAYDVIAFVGIAYYLHGHSLHEIQQELCQRTPSVKIPLSSLYDLCGYFLHLFGQLHRSRAEQLRALCARDGKSVWLLDCTQERASPAFFGILETHHGILLGCWKVPSENQIALVPCLREAVQHFGKPGRLLHDLSSTMSTVRDTVLPDVPDSVCHFHFARDVGEELFRQAHKELSDRLHALKLQVRLREQRKDQTDMQALPAEALLVGNLEIAEYVAVVLGSLEELPQRLAEVGGQESFRSWKAREQPRQVGQVPRCFLRQPDFLDRLLGVCLALHDSP
jgi:hypothetical protein